MPSANSNNFKEIWNLVWDRCGLDAEDNVGFVLRIILYRSINSETVLKTRKQIQVFLKENYD